MNTLNCITMCSYFLTVSFLDLREFWGDLTTLLYVFCSTLQHSQPKENIVFSFEVQSIVNLNMMGFLFWVSVFISYFCGCLGDEYMVNPDSGMFTIAKTCIHICKSGACYFNHCPSPKCPGGACHFVNSHNPTCAQE